MSNHNTYRSRRNLRGAGHWQAQEMAGVVEPYTADEAAENAAKHEAWLRSLGLGAIADRMANEEAAKVAKA